ncbi:MAG: TetR/AcrR family transcriptional regulator [Planctomycetaceae bacterium]|nr:TetR/AcrR family transcriptional regulator [Planctomycetaceae bacterium]
MVRKDTRELLLDAAVVVVNEIGFYRATMDAIVAQAEFSKGCLTHYFKTKNQCLLAVIDRYFERILTDAHTIYAELPEGPGRMLKAYLQSWVNWQEPPGPVQMMGMLEDPELRERVIEYRISHYELVLDGLVPEFVAQKTLLWCAGLWTTPFLARATPQEMSVFRKIMLDEMFAMIDASVADSAAG